MIGSDDDSYDFLPPQALAALRAFADRPVLSPLPPIEPATLDLLKGWPDDDA